MLLEKIMRDDFSDLAGWKLTYPPMRIWSITATVSSPSQVIGIRIGGLAFGELDRGTTTTVPTAPFVEHAGPRRANL
jgi:hypothetical protein